MNDTREEDRHYLYYMAARIQAASDLEKCVQRAIRYAAAAEYDAIEHTAAVLLALESAHGEVGMKGDSVQGPGQAGRRDARERHPRRTLPPIMTRSEFHAAHQRLLKE